MAKKTDTVTVVTYSLLIIANIILHMLLSDVSVGRLITQIFKEPTGIFQSIWFVASWLFLTLFSVNGIYLIGLTIAFIFLILPLMVRYKYITVKPDLVLALIFAMYTMLLFRIIGVVFG